MAKRRQFYQLSPVCYRVSLWKEGLRKSLADRRSGFWAAELRQEESLPVIVKSHRSPVLRRLEGVDMALQQSKRANLALAAGCIDGVVIRPGESFSFWRLVGDPTARRGFGPGLTIASGRVGTGVGGGLCQAGNLLHYLVLHSPLTVTELHHHSDALFPDDRRRVPFGTGTSIFYPHIDYRFRNDTGQTVQLRLWLEEDDLCGELRSQTPFPLRYRLREEDSHYVKEGADYYRVSRVYRLTLNGAGEQVNRELLLDNHSKVLFDPALIPPDQLREETP